MPAHRANKPVLKEPLQTNFRTHIALHADLRVNQPLSQIARRFQVSARARMQTSGATAATAAMSSGPNATTKAVVGSDGEQALHTLNFRGGCSTAHAAAVADPVASAGASAHICRPRTGWEIACHLPQQPAQGTAHGGGIAQVCAPRPPRWLRPAERRAQPEEESQDRTRWLPLR